MAATGTLASLTLRFRGCLMGSHVGDCLGSPFEGDTIVSKSLLTEYFTKLLKEPAEGSVVQAHPYTDDTAMTLAVGESLANKCTFDPLDMAKRFVDEYFQHPRRGYGENVVHVFQALKRSSYTDVFLPAKLQFNGSGSYGNGSAMRIAPVALYCYNHGEEMLKCHSSNWQIQWNLSNMSPLQNVLSQSHFPPDVAFVVFLDIAKNSSLLTHTHQNGYNGAILQCLAVYQALKVDPSTKFCPIQFTNSLLKKMEDIENPIENVSSLDQKMPYCASLTVIREIFEKKTTNLTPVAIADLLGHYVSAHKSVPTAIYCFLRSMQPLDDFQSDNPFVRAIYFAISVGGDTDTIAAMTGAMAGAYYGQESIPISLQKRCEALDSSINLADKLLALISTK